MAEKLPESSVLLGDSIFKRLLAENPGLFSPLSDKFCVSGQRAADLYALIRGSREELRGRPVIILIGTNDILSNSPLDKFRLLYRSIVRYLRRLKCVITLCELLPIPKLGGEELEDGPVECINKFIRSFEPSGIKLIHTHSVFVESGCIKSHLFCQYLGRSRRVDLVHPNKEGLCCLLLTLEL